jgi:hypothetical protein
VALSFISQSGVSELVKQNVVPNIYELGNAIPSDVRVGKDVVGTRLGNVQIEASYKHH